MLGYAADTVTIVPRLRCYGCPRHPFVAAHLRRTFHLSLVPRTDSRRLHRFRVGGRRAQVSGAGDRNRRDLRVGVAGARSGGRSASGGRRLPPAGGVPGALGQQEQQSATGLPGCRSASRAASQCRRPLAMIQDLGASFGPPKVNLARWRDLPIWYDRTSCLVSMRALPFEGATFEDVRVSEAGRALAANAARRDLRQPDRAPVCRRPLSAVSGRDR